MAGGGGGALQLSGDVEAGLALPAGEEWRNAGDGRANGLRSAGSASPVQHLAMGGGAGVFVPGYMSPPDRSLEYEGLVSSRNTPRRKFGPYQLPMVGRSGSSAPSSGLQSKANSPSVSRRTSAANTPAPGSPSFLVRTVLGRHRLKNGDKSLGSPSARKVVVLEDWSIDGGASSAKAASVFDLHIKDLTYKVPDASNAGKKAGQEKILLNKVTCRALHGEILAVVGPSGSSKTTFLDAVAGRIEARSLQGSVLVNGVPAGNKMQRISQYVMQDDSLFPMLTVRETLMYSARLRLPGSMSAGEKNRRVNWIIKQLGLTDCANTIVGGEGVAGVSGGERRRVSIGVELIHDPAVILLDEPTSGLDSSAALQVIQILSALAEQRKRTVILSIHQPSFRILDLLHRMLVFAKGGNSVFHGPYSEMTQHFSDLGKPVPRQVNVVEYAIDIVEEFQKDPEDLQQLLQFYQERQLTKELATQFEEVNKHKLEEEPASGAEEDGASISLPTYANGFFREALTIAGRTTRSLLRTQELFHSRVALMVVTALVLGTIFLRLGDHHTIEGARKREAFLVYTVATFIFTSVEAIPVLQAERQIVKRELSRGVYRPVSYAIAHTLVFIPPSILQALLYTGMVYFLVGLVANAQAFCVMVLAIFLTLNVTTALVSAVSAIVPNFVVGFISITAVGSYMFLFSGFFIPRRDIPDYYIWLHYLSLFKYPYEITLENEFGHLKHVVWTDNTNPSSPVRLTSQQVLAQQGADTVSIPLNAALLVMFTFAYRFLFYVALKFNTKNVRQ